MKEPESQSACHQFYLKASGRYSPVQLNQLSTPEDVSLNEPVLDSTLLLSPLHKAEKDFKKSLKVIEVFLNSMATKVSKMRAKYASTSSLLRRIIVTMNCDSYCISRQSIRIGGSPDPSKLIVNYSLESGRIKYNRFIQQQAEEAAKMPKDSVFVLKKRQLLPDQDFTEEDGDFITSDYSEVITRVRRHEDFVTHQTDILLAKHGQQYEEVLSVDDFYTRGRSCLSLRLCCF